MSHALGGHDLVQSADPWPLTQADPLALTELGVEAPHSDDKHQVEDAPEDHTHHKTWDHEVPLVPVPELLRGQDDEGPLHRQQRQQGQPPPQAPPQQEGLPALGHGQAAEVHVQQGVADQLAEEAGEGERVGGDVQRVEVQQRGDGGEAQQVEESQDRLHPEGDHDGGQRHHQHHHAQGLLEEQRHAGDGEAHQLHPLRRGEEGGSVPGAAQKPLQQRPQRPEGHAGQQQVVGHLLLHVALHRRAVEEAEQPQQEAEPQVQDEAAHPLHAEVVVEDASQPQDEQSQHEDGEQRGVRGPLPAGVEPQAQGEHQAEPGQVPEPPHLRPPPHLPVHLLQPGHGCVEAVAETVA